MSITVTIPAPPALTVTVRTQSVVYHLTAQVADQTSETADRQLTMVVQP